MHCSLRARIPTAGIDFGSVDEYIAVQPEARGVLECVRSSVRKAMPTAEEAISHKMPAFKLNGGAVLWFVGWKRHYSLYPARDRLVAEAELSGAWFP